MMKEEVFWRIQCRPPKIIVPSQIIIHVTSVCPKKCAGCYSKAWGWTGDLELDLFEKIIKEGEELGKGYIFFGISGGEPLARSDIWDIIALHPSSHFIVYTSGAGFWQQVNQLKKLSNIFLFFSSKINSKRRETGENLEEVLDYCRKTQLPFGISLLVTQENIELLTSEEYLMSWAERGVQSFLFMCFRLFAKEEEKFGHSLQYKEIKYLFERVTVLQKSLGMPMRWGLAGFVGVTDCLAGRKVISISPSGEIQLCPFAPISLGNIRTCSLGQALNSPICRAVRLINPVVNKVLRIPWLNPCQGVFGRIVH